MPAKKTNKVSVAPAAAQQNLNQSKAIVSLVLGIAGLVLCWVPILGPVLSVVALVLGIKSKKLAEEQPIIYGGKGLALAGLILGIIGLVLGVIYTIYWIFIVFIIASVFSTATYY